MAASGKDALHNQGDQPCMAADGHSGVQYRGSTAHEAILQSNNWQLDVSRILARVDTTSTGGARHGLIKVDTEI